MSADHQEQALADAICRHLASAVATLIGGSSVTAPAAPPTAGWYVGLVVEGRGSGRLWLGLAGEDATAIAKQVLGVDEEPAEGAVRDTLRELVAQAIGIVALEPLVAGFDIRVETVESSFKDTPSTPASAWAFDIGNGTTVVLAVWSSVRLDAPAPAQPSRSGVRSDASQGRGASAGSTNLDLVLDIDLPMSVRFGRTELALGALTRLGPGSVIDLGRSPDEPVEVLVSGRVVARGDVVVVGGNFGVRVTDVLPSVGAPRD